MMSPRKSAQGGGRGAPGYHWEAGAWRPDASKGSSDTDNSHSTQQTNLTNTIKLKHQQSELGRSRRSIMDGNTKEDLVQQETVNGEKDRDRRIANNTDENQDVN